MIVLVRGGTPQSPEAQGARAKASGYSVEPRSGPARSPRIKTRGGLCPAGPVSALFAGYALDHRPGPALLRVFLLRLSDAARHGPSRFRKLHSGVGEWDMTCALRSSQNESVSWLKAPFGAKPGAAALPRALSRRRFRGTRLTTAVSVVRNPPSIEPDDGILRAGAGSGIPKAGRLSTSFPSAAQRATRLRERTADMTRIHLSATISAQVNVKRTVRRGPGGDSGTRSFFDLELLYAISQTRLT